MGFGATVATHQPTWQVPMKPCGSVVHQPYYFHSQRAKVLRSILEKFQAEDIVSIFMNECSTYISHALKIVTFDSTATNYTNVNDIKSNIHKMTDVIK
jgi:hypothetical protein